MAALSAFAPSAARVRDAVARHVLTGLFLVAGSVVSDPHPGSRAALEPDPYARCR